MEWCMAMGYGKIKKVKNLLENGKLIKRMVMESMSPKLVTIKVIILITLGEFNTF